MFRVALFILIAGCTIYLLIGFWIAMLVAGASSLSSASIRTWDFIKIMFFWIIFLIVGT
jgi:hypothetical protein